MTSFLKLTLASAVLAATAAPVLAQVGRFDGNWSVEIVTERGECDKAYRYAVAIENGRARAAAGNPGFDISGSVAPSGAVTGSISRGQDRASVNGRLSGNTGSGTWTAAGSRTCSGSWSADKRG